MDHCQRACRQGPGQPQHSMCATALPQGQPRSLESSTPCMRFQPDPRCTTKARLRCCSILAAASSPCVADRGLHAPQPLPHACSQPVQPKTQWVINTGLRSPDPAPMHRHGARQLQVCSPCVTDIGLHCPKPASVEEDGRRLPLSAAQKSGRGGLATDQTILASSMGSPAGIMAEPSRAEAHLAWGAQVHSLTCSNGLVLPAQARSQTGTVAAELKQSTPARHVIAQHWQGCEQESNLMWSWCRFSKLAKNKATQLQAKSEQPPPPEARPTSVLKGSGGYIHLQGLRFCAST